MLHLCSLSGSYKDVSCAVFGVDYQSNNQAGLFRKLLTFVGAELCLAPTVGGENVNNGANVNTVRVNRYWWVKNREDVPRKSDVW